MFQIRSAFYSDAGDRSVNEDSVRIEARRSAFFYALADGLGGQGMGDEASSLACRISGQQFLRSEKVDNDILKSFFRLSQQAILNRKNELRVAQKMMTTLNLLCISDGTAYWGHVGDGRTYFFQGNKIVCRTFDHSVPQMLAAAGRIRESDIRFHEDRNRLLKALGTVGDAADCEIEESIPLAGGERFLLCSDGFWEAISEEKMSECLSAANDPQTWLDLMRRYVSREKETKTDRDNNSAVVVWIDA